MNNSCTIYGEVRPILTRKSKSTYSGRVDKKPIPCDTTGVGKDTLTEITVDKGADLRSSAHKWFLQETARYLDGMARCVREVKHVDEASRFARWLFFSGILQEIKRDSVKLASDVDSLLVQTDTLIRDCGDIFSTGKAHPKYAESDIAEIHAKLEVLARAIIRPESSSYTIVTKAPPDQKPEPQNGVGTGVGGLSLASPAEGVTIPEMVARRASKNSPVGVLRRRGGGL